MSVLLIIFLVGGFFVAALVVGALITKEYLDRQKRIMKMKRFRKSVQPQKADFTSDDKRTMI